MEQGSRILQSSSVDYPHRVPMLHDYIPVFVGIVEDENDGEDWS